VSPHAWVPTGRLWRRVMSATMAMVVTAAPQPIVVDCIAGPWISGLVAYTALRTVAPVGTGRLP
jgi:hypothetical protein